VGAFFIEQGAGRLQDAGLVAHHASFRVFTLI
jgi:hypothetical protein